MNSRLSFLFNLFKDQASVFCVLIPSLDDPVSSNHVPSTSHLLTVTDHPAAPPYHRLQAQVTAGINSRPNRSSSPAPLSSVCHSSMSLTPPQHLPRCHNLLAHLQSWALSFLRTSKCLSSLILAHYYPIISLISP